MATTSAKSGEGKGSSSGGRRSPSPVSFLAGASSSPRIGKGAVAHDDDIPGRRRIRRAKTTGRRAEEEAVVVVIVPLSRERAKSCGAGLMLMRGLIGGRR